MWYECSTINTHNKIHALKTTHTQHRIHYLLASEHVSIYTYIGTFIYYTHVRDG